MKKRLLLLALFGFTVANAQLIVTPNPFDINSGILTITYGSSADYSLFDPQSDPNLYLYSGLETDGNAATWDYHDTWSDLNSLTPLTWNALANAYVATFDIGGRNYTQEATNTLMQVPTGTSVNNWYFIIRNAAGNRQSGNLTGSTYGFTPGLSTPKFSIKNVKFNVINNIVSTDATGEIEIEIYSVTGQKVKTIRAENYEAILEMPLELTQKGVYIAVLKNNGQIKSLKFMY